MRPQKVLPLRFRVDLHIPQSSRTGASPSDDLVSYPECSLGKRSYISAEVQSAFSAAPVKWAAKDNEQFYKEHFFFFFAILYFI